MDVFPSLPQERLLLNNKAHSASDLAARHALGPEQDRCAFRTGQVDFSLTVAEDMDVRWRVVVGVDDDTHTIDAQHSDHDCK
jgi:hypothetical protein